MRFDIRADVREAQKFVKGLDQKGVRRATQNALNVTNTAVRQISETEIKKRRRLKQGVGTVGMALYKRRASPQNLRAITGARTVKIPLKHYQGTKQHEQGVEANPTGKGKKIIPRAFGPGLKGRGRGKNRKAARPAVLGGHVYQRKGKSRLPIKKLYGPSIHTGFIHRVVRSAQRRVIRNQWPLVLKQKMNDQLRKLRAKHGRAG